MKPVSVRFKCFGPYRKEMFVDFEELEKKGLFLICGETGAGKTTILDAICYALYGKSSGGLRGDLSVMRCKSAEPSEETVTEFTFDANGKRYRFVRTLRYGRKNLIDEHNCMVLKEGEFVPIFENPKLKNVNQKAEEIIGLNYDQFRQVIILPQGQFEKLLVSDSAEKEKILVSLFKAEKWQLIADEIYERVAEEDKRLKAEILDIRSRLSDYECESLDELKLKADAGKNHLLEMEKASDEVQLCLKEQKKIQEKAILLNEQFLELEKRTKQVNNLENESAQIEVLEKRVRKADEAEEIRPVYEQYKNALERKNTGQKQKEQAEIRLAGEKQMLDRVKVKKQELEARKPVYEAGVKKALLLESEKERYISLEEKKAQAQKLLKEYNEQKKVFETEKQRFEKAHRNWLEKMEVEKEKIARYTEAQQIYLSGISGILAEKLEAGSPCPVCGSREHPSPAILTGRKITEKELDHFQQEMQAANRLVSEAAKMRAEEEQKYEKYSEKVKIVEQQYLTSKAAYEEACAGKLEGIENTSQLEAVLKDLKGQIAKYEELEVRLQNSLNESSSKVQAAEEVLHQRTEELELQEAELKARVQIWNTTLEHSGFSKAEEFEACLMEAAEKNRLKNQMITFRTRFKAAKEALEEQTEQLSGLERPELDKMKADLDKTETEQKRMEKEKILAQQNLERMKKSLENLSLRKAAYDVQRQKNDGDLEFANRLRGRSGVSLQRYVLGVMLSSITAEANRLLKNVHKGRYQLYRTDSISGSGRKGGLELEVLDIQNNERRSVTTLSGGEKFLVALSLAIGLSTVVQAQGKGMKLGAMFIDEGFGSLDENSIYDALEVLQGIQRANGLVGIISHVELLREVIPGKIEVQKSKEGSWF